jgi:hypothetical protein
MEEGSKEEMRQYYQAWPYTNLAWTTSNLHIFCIQIGYLAGILWPQMNFSASNTFPYSRFIDDTTYHARKHALLCTLGNVQ